MDAIVIRHFHRIFVFSCLQSPRVLISVSSRQCLLPILQAILAGGALHADDQIQTHVDAAFSAVWQWLEFDEYRSYPAATAASAASLNASGSSHDSSALAASISAQHATVRVLYLQRSATQYRLTAWRMQRWLLRHAWVKTVRSGAQSVTSASDSTLELASHVHWRYQLMSAVAIHATSRAALPVTSALTTFWTRVLGTSVTMRGNTRTQKWKIFHHDS